MINAQGHADNDVFLSLKRFVSTEAEGPREDDWKEMMATFFVVERGIFLMRWLIDFAIPDESEEAVMAQKRRDLMEANFAGLISNATGGSEIHAVHEYRYRPKQVQVQVPCAAASPARDTFEPCSSIEDL